jgi:hypothetical protein
MVVSRWRQALAASGFADFSPQKAAVLLPLAAKGLYHEAVRHLVRKEVASDRVTLQVLHGPPQVVVVGSAPLWLLVGSFRQSTANNQRPMLKRRRLQLRKRGLLRQACNWSRGRASNLVLVRMLPVAKKKRKSKTACSRKNTLWTAKDRPRRMTRL